MSLLLACLLTTTALGGEEPAQIEVRLAGADDRVALQSTELGIVVEITSPRGIGRGALAPVDEAWPAQVTLRLALADLEGFHLAAEGVRLHGFLGGEATEIERNPDAGEDLPTDEELQLVIRQVEEGVIEVEVPPALLEWGPDTMRIQWVDFYR